MKFLVLGSVFTLMAPSAAAAPVTALDMTPSIRAVGMGEAYTAADDDVFGGHYNPALSLKRRQASIGFQKGVLDESFGSVGFGSPLPFGSAAANLSYYNGGDIELISSNGTRRNVSAQKDLLALAALGVDLRQDLTLGGGAKIIHSRFLDDFKTTAVLFDAGVLYKASSLFSLGAAVQNMGSKLKYAGQGDDAPRQFRLGAAYKQWIGAHKATIAVDQLLNDAFGESRQHIGLELLYASTLALRVGYKRGYDTGNLSVGLGLQRESIAFDFAMLPGSELSPGVKVGITGRF